MTRGGKCSVVVRWGETAQPLCAGGRPHSAMRRGRRFGGDLIFTVPSEAAAQWSCSGGEFAQPQYSGHLSHCPTSLACSGHIRFA